MQIEVRTFGTPKVSVGQQEERQRLKLKGTDEQKGLRPTAGITSRSAACLNRFANIQPFFRDASSVAKNHETVIFTSPHLKLTLQVLLKIMLEIGNRSVARPPFPR